MQIELPDYVLLAIDLLNQSGYEAYAVGGCIRNALLGLPIYDYDVTTSATPDEMKDVFHDYTIIETGIAHGTLTIHIHHNAVEITTFRIEKKYVDHRHPSLVIFSRILSDDLSRRDFTVNALAYHPTIGIIDKFHGIDDLHNHIIRAINDPNERFDEDALRIMRALRFASVLGFTIEEATAKALHNNKGLLNSISKERIHSELVRLLMGDHVFEIITTYSDILGTIIPELLPMVDCPHENPHHIYDIYTHTTHVVENVPNHKNLRMAALLHDIGKPFVKTYDNAHIAHYPKHSEKSKELASIILRRLKFSNKDTQAILKLIQYHDVYLEPNKIQLKKILSILGKELTYQLLDLQIADNHAKNIEYRKTNEFNLIRNMLDEIIDCKECYQISMLAINGNDVVTLGANHSSISTILNQCLEAVINEQVINTKEDIYKYIAHNLL